jgi:hypothetical protein
MKLKHEQNCISRKEHRVLKGSNALTFLKLSFLQKNEIKQLETETFMV